MMKRLTALLLCLALLCATACAEITTTPEYDEDYLLFTGIYAHEAFVLCETLSVRESPSTSAKVLRRLHYGDTFLTTSENLENWVNVCNETGIVGWVRSEYVLQWPMYLTLENSAKAFSYPNTAAPVVGLLDPGTTLAIIPQSTTESWFLVSLRGAAAWVKRAPKTAQEPETLTPAQLRGLTRADLTWTKNGQQTVYTVTDAGILAEVEALLTDMEARATTTGCPFGFALLKLTRADGTALTLDLAADDCCTFRVGGRCYAYALSHRDPMADKSATNEMLFGLFGQNIKSY